MGRAKGKGVKSGKGIAGRAEKGDKKVTAIGRRQK